ncbi:MAG: hypothetical protein K2X44_12825 [Magnetospirillum sp.]|nr:hypothetical protein [Magnetospirillum sp.]
MVRTGLRGALFSIGFRTISETGSFIKLHDLIEQDAIDLLVSSSELEGNDAGFLISEMRNQRLGPNPFLPVITLLASADPDYVKRVIDSGPDDLLLTPVQPDQLIMRIEKLTRTRKPFVVTHDYTGPDRRTKARAFENHSAPMLEVPNPLKVRADSGIDGTRLNRMITETSITLNRMKIERHAVQIDWLVNHIHASIRDGISAEPQILLPYTSKLTVTAEDMIRRMKNTPTEAFTGPISELLEIAKKVDEAPAKVAFNELERLAVLSKLTSRSLGSPAVAKAAAAAAPASAQAPVRIQLA